MAKSRNVKQITQESGFYEPYSHFSRTLRAWLVAYGIGFDMDAMPLAHILRHYTSAIALADRLQTAARVMTVPSEDRPPVE